MDFESYGSDPPIPPEVDYCAPLRPQVHALHVETEEDRFPTREDIQPPRIAAWRCNLAASSQRRNLLFVASSSDIHVWVPSGPFQMLGSQPEMIIKPEMKMPSAAGYIDRENPHAINAILVDDLGRDEVLLLATDSGNVCGYHVEAIHSALARCKEEGLARPFDGTQVGPFFTEHVGRSAWGLATHKFARLIAVSSNTGLITVFAFALVHSAVNEDEMLEISSAQNCSLMSDQTWVSINKQTELRALQKLMPHNHRSRNLKLIYKGHFDNIPSVSFANFDLDANGIWMVSTDISNRVIVWRLWDDLSPYRVYTPGDHAVNALPKGWAVLALDPRTFKHHKRRDEACGCDPTLETIGPRTLLDVSRGIEKITDASQIVAGRYEPPRSVTPTCLPDDLVSPEECVSEDRSGSPTGLGQGSLQASDQTREDDDGGCLSDSSLTSEYVEHCFAQRPRVRSKRPLISLHDDNPHRRVNPYLSPGFGVNWGPNLDPLWSEPVHRMILLAVHSQKYLRAISGEPKLTCHVSALFPGFYPIMHFSDHNISLAPYPMDSEYHLVCRSPLFQTFRSLEIPPYWDRFNMVKYIPELGLVVAASQKGRVAIISLTWQEEVGFGFRVDWIVPFFTQEKRNERPEDPLLGLAVSPMQGFETPQDVPCIPQDVDPDDWFTFNYRILDQDETDASSSPSSPRPSSPARNPTNHSAPVPSAGSNPNPDSKSPSESEESDQDMTSSHAACAVSERDTTCKTHTHENDHGTHTLPELHAEAFRAYYPHENWHGWHPSRHYRLLLIFYDHTVMSYEFWHDWKLKAT